MGATVGAAMFHSIGRVYALTSAVLCSHLSCRSRWDMRHGKGYLEALILESNMHWFAVHDNRLNSTIK